MRPGRRAQDGKAAATGLPSPPRAPRGRIRLMDDTAKRFGVLNPFDEASARKGASDYLEPASPAPQGRHAKHPHGLQLGRGQPDAWL